MKPNIAITSRLPTLNEKPELKDDEMSSSTKSVFHSDFKKNHRKTKSLKTLKVNSKFKQQSSS